MDLTTLAGDLEQMDLPTCASSYTVTPYWATARFAAETVIILLSLFLNTSGLALVYTTHKDRKSVYHLLYINISVSNIVACPLTWFFGNIQFFFPGWFQENLRSDSTVYHLAALLSRYKVVTSLAVAVHMNIAMLSLGVCQYFAICRPLQSVYMMQKRRAYFMIAVAWCALVLCAVLPFVVLYFRSAASGTDGGSDVTCFETADMIKRGIRLTANTYGCVIIALYVIMVTLAVLITTSLLQYSRRTYSLARTNSITCDMERLRGEQRACIATAALLASRTLITIPLTIYFLLELNSDAPSRSMATFILSIVPCAKCLFDPFIYGSLMRDVRKTWRRVTSRFTHRDVSYSYDVATKEMMLTNDRSSSAT